MLNGVDACTHGGLQHVAADGEGHGGAGAGDAAAGPGQGQHTGGGGRMGTMLERWVTPLTCEVLIAFRMNGFLVALLGEPGLVGIAPIIK